MNQTLLEKVRTNYEEMAGLPVPHFEAVNMESERLGSHDVYVHAQASLNTAYPLTKDAARRILTARHEQLLSNNGRDTVPVDDAMRHVHYSKGDGKLLEDYPRHTIFLFPHFHHLNPDSQEGLLAHELTHLLQLERGLADRFPLPHEGVAFAVQAAYLARRVERRQYHEETARTTRALQEGVKTSRPLLRYWRTADWGARAVLDVLGIPLEKQTEKLAVAPIGEIFSEAMYQAIQSRTAEIFLTERRD